MSFAKKLRSELLYSDIQIKELARKINIPYSTLLSYLDKNERIPRVDIAIKIAKELGVSVETLTLDKRSKQKNSLSSNIIAGVLHKNLYDDISLLPLEIQKYLLLLVREILDYIENSKREKK